MKRNKIIVRSIELFTALIGILMAFVGKSFILSKKVGKLELGGRMNLFAAIDEAKNQNVLRLSSVLYVVSVIVLFITAVWFVLSVIAEVSKNKKLAGPLNELSLVTSCYYVAIILLVGLAAVFTSHKTGIDWRFAVSFKSAFTYLYIVGACASVCGEVFLLKNKE